MVGGYTLTDKGTWNEVTFTKEEEDKIKKYYQDHHVVDYRKICRELFPELAEDTRSKNNAIYQIKRIIDFSTGA